ncbi:AAA family ATPase [Microvenator marinus]|uniref:AAA family ATPase n=1 Tax=Microvenator marinus TaxID=2600177 RepID=A0A5B8XQX0_9DELT|nr:AAA family ATPase [Microvenator marinus]QED28302.1 AAA family ATPase [Microvenator marinus]
MQNVEEEARQILEELGQSQDEERYRILRDQLYGLGPSVIEILRGELHSPNYRRRMAAATNLGRMGDTESVPVIIQLLNDPLAHVREMALFALGIIGEPSAVDAIVHSLSDYDANVRFRAVVALGDLGYPQLEDVLINAMSDESYGVREQALSQLRQVGTPRAMPVILRGLLEREYEMQQMAEEAVDRLIPRMSRENYKQVQEALTMRERRLILNYLESRNLQEVYGALWQRLQVVSAKSAAPQKGLDKYGRLLNAPHERDQLNHAWGRDDVVELLVQHFMEPSAERSILLVGDTGTGKSAIVHEMARRLIELGEKGDEEEAWQILETNTSELMSGTRYLGDWETKLKEMAEVVMKHKRVILYMTNPNDLLGAGAHSKSDENFADFFKPYLQRGEIRIIAECTEESMKNGLSREPGFLRLFKQVKVHPMNDAETLEVLENRIEGLVHEKKTVEAEPHCLEHIVDFARSFYTRSVAPGRACDLMDALVDFTARQPHTEDKLVLKRADIPTCLSEVTGISLDLLDDTIPLDLEHTEQWFSQRLIDQNQAIDGIVNRLSLIKTGLTAPEKPLGIYFLVGPTGVGKTYFTKLVAERLFGDPKRMVRFDLSEYQGRYAVEKLIGSPHDKDREGLLTEAVRNQPYCVLLFDEFEKADPEIFSLFLQIMDEGRLTDARGETTDFRQTLIFLTSNLGASKSSVAPLGFSNEAEAAFEGKIQKKLEEFFAPEFLNRLDDVVVFEPLTPQAMDRLVQLELNKAFERRGFLRRRIHVTADRSARKWLEENGFSSRYGARELHRVIEKAVLTPISRLLVEEADAARDLKVTVSASDSGIEVKVNKTKKPVPKDPGQPPVGA